MTHEFDGPVRQDPKFKIMEKTIEKLRLIRNELEQNPGQSIGQLARKLKVHRNTIVRGLQAMYRIQVFPFRINGGLYLSEEPHEFQPTTPSQAKAQPKPKLRSRAQPRSRQPGEPLIRRIETNGIGGRDMIESEIRNAWYE